MKVIVAFLVAISLVLLVACGGDESLRDSQVSEGERGILYHDAVDKEPAALPQDRKEALALIAQEFVESQILGEYRDLTYPINEVEEDRNDGDAQVLVVGYFLEEGEWIEKEAVVRLNQTDRGGWGLETEFSFNKTDAQQFKESQERAEIYREEQRKKNLEELESLLEAFDSIIVRVDSANYTTEKNEWGFEQIRFVLYKENSTSNHRTVWFKIDWSAESSDSSGCNRPFEGSYVGNPYIQVGAGKTSSVYTPIRITHCSQVTSINYSLVIIKIDEWDSRDQVEEEIAKNK